MHNEHLVYLPFPSEGNYQNLDGQSGEGLKRIFVASGARSAERVLLWFKGEISDARPDPTRPNATRPNPTPSRFWEAYISGTGWPIHERFFFVRCHHSINFVFDRYRYPPVPATARGTCRGEGVEDTLSLGNSTTAGPIAFKFGVWLGTH